MGGKSPNAQTPKAAARKSRIAGKTVRRRGSSAAREETKVARLTRELKEAFRQQTATADVLKGSSVGLRINCSHFSRPSAAQPRGNPVIGLFFELG